MSVMKILRTPDDRFANLAGFDYQPNYAEIPDLQGGALRVHYLDEGPPTAPPILLMHGEPSWCYLYRHMIPTLVDAGYRCIAPIWLASEEATSRRRLRTTHTPDMSPG